MPSCSPSAASTPTSTACSLLGPDDAAAAALHACRRFGSFHQVKPEELSVLNHIDGYLSTRGQTLRSTAARLPGAAPAGTSPLGGAPRGGYLSPMTNLDASAKAALAAADRTVLRIGGPGARAFLQGLVSNDLARLDAGAVYAALLTPQGKYLFDFFLGRRRRGRAPRRQGRPRRGARPAPRDVPPARAGHDRAGRARGRSRPRPGRRQARFADPRAPGLGWRASRPTRRPSSPACAPRPGAA